LLVHLHIISIVKVIEKNIRAEAKKQGIRLYVLASEIGLTEPGFYAMLNKESMKVKTLEKIAEVLQVPFALLIADMQDEPVKPVEQTIQAPVVKIYTYDAWNQSKQKQKLKLE